MFNKKTEKTIPLSKSVDNTQKIEEAAYYSYLNRGRIEQAGDELTDWLEAEKYIRSGTR
jgi:hypothetical protein